VAGFDPEGNRVFRYPNGDYHNEDGELVRKAPVINGGA